ncbi:hypothetical protein F511_24019 [Dorcoceras hygrometricum]|uniref:Uncharacterized protein n=1 Tax=Dorcoceras hygrometricum TaxID=472368 RepID=A0A2Z7ARU8_9LAMI|nr:hypothetical protein F511_24019 [Dorcoceras hygrometricum]
MVVDLIGIYGLKGPYYTLTTTDWFLQALSVILMGSWGDVARRFTMIRWADSRTDTQLNVLSTRIGFWGVRLPKSQQGSNRGFPLLRGKTVILQFRPPSPPLNSRRRRPRAAAADLRRKFVSGRFDEENPFVQNSSMLLVQPDEGVSVLVVDRIGDYLPQSTEKSRVLVIPVGARHKCQEARAQPRDRPAHSLRTAADPRPLIHMRVSHVAGRGSCKVARCWMRRGCALVALHADAPCATVADRCRCMLSHDVRRWPDGEALQVDAGSSLCARRLRAICARRCVALARRLARCRRSFRWCAAAGRPPLPRVSGDVVTAGLISSRVWFGPVPGSP